MSALLTALLLVGTTASVPDWDLRYDVTVPADLSRLDVRLCFGASYPRRLAVHSVLGLTSPHPVTRAGMDLGALKRGECARYSVAALAEDGSVVVSGRSLLLPPALLGPNIRGTVRFHLPPGASVVGVNVVAPWLPAKGGALALDRATFTMTSRVAIGRVSSQRFSLLGAHVTLAVIDADYAAGAAGIRAWITAAIKAAAGLWGRFPRTRLLVLVRPSSRPGKRVFFGRAHRGGCGHVELFLPRNALAAALIGEWVAIHELLHLGLPWIEENWMSEGFVTYYEEVMRTRAGHLTAVQLWEELLDGFKRGAASGGTATLEVASRTMHQTRAYKRVYWGGAAIALATDVAIRQASGGKRSLDAAITQLQSDSGSAEDFNAQQVMTRLDAWLGRPLMMDTATPMLGQVTFPDLTGTLEALGVRQSDGRVILDDKAPLAHIRRAIERGH
ncbi:MAG: hypothetical protein ACI9WU_000293 [Myxococcota bacterium]